MCVNRGSYHLTKGKIYSADICSDAPSEYFPGKQVFDYYVINLLFIFYFNFFKYI